MVGWGVGMGGVARRKRGESREGLKRLERGEEPEKEHWVGAPNPIKGLSNIQTQRGFNSFIKENMSC